MICSTRVFALALSVLAASTACDEKAKSSSEGEGRDAGAEKVESKVEMALANAVKASSGVIPNAANAGPPADGVMDPSRADTEVPSGMPPKITIGNEGASPKYRLRGAQAALPKHLVVEMTIQGGSEQGLPPIEVDLSLESKPLRASAVPPIKGREAATGSEGATVTGRVRDTRVSMPNLPKEFTDQLKGLKGGKIHFSLSADGAGFGFSTELPSGAKPELKDLLDTAAEGVALMTIPVPSVPVGAGAIWMVASRETAAGVGMVSYRMVKVLNITEKTAELEFDARRYAVGRQLDPAMFPPGGPIGELREVAAGAKAHFKWTADSILAVEMEGDSALRGVIGEVGAARTPPRGAGPVPGQRMIQSATAYRVKTAP